jgi:hypothetical protein
LKTFTIKNYLLLLVAPLFIAGITYGQQNMTVSHGREIRSATINFAELAAYEAAHPTVEPRKTILHESEGQTPENMYTPDNAPMINDNEPWYQGHVVGSVSPPPVHNFAGLNDNGNGIPPDVGGATGPTHIMEVLNTQVRVMTRTGTTVSTVSLNAYWASLGSPSTFDPKVYYDHLSNRWIFITIAQAQTANSEILLGVSATSDPTGTWHLYAIDADATNVNWLDFPSVGYNNKWITVMGNMFSVSSSVFSGSAIFSIDKASVYAGGPANFTRTSGSLFTVCPAQTYDATQDTMFLVNVLGSTQLRIYRITGAVGSEVLATHATVTSSAWGCSGCAGNFAPQFNSTDLFDVGDWRMQSVVYRNGSIWAAHTAFMPSTGRTRSIVQWWQFATNGTVIQKGRIEDPSSNIFYAYPSIAVNAAGDAFVAYTRFAYNEYPSAEYAMRCVGDPLNVMRDGYRFKLGEATYFKDFGSGRNRWGDYTAACVDPLNDSTFWAVSEYSKSPSSTWGTWISEVYPCRTSYVDFNADTTVICNGTPLQFHDLTTFGETSRLWTFTGGNPATDTSANPTVTYSTTGVKSVTLVVNGTDTMIHNNYVVVLAVPVSTVTITGATTFCQGGSVTLTASVTGTSWLWNNNATTRAITVNTSGTYFCVLTNALGCTNTSVSTVVTVNPLPTVTLAAFPPQVCDTITNYPLTGGNPSGGTYTGTQVSGNVFHPSAAGDGTYNITYTYTDGNNCTNSAVQPLTVGTNCFVGIAEPTVINSLSVIPNPAHNSISVSFTPKAIADMSMNITNTIGQKVFDKNIGRSSSYSETIDISKIPVGIYFLNLNANGETITKKLVIE